MPDYLVPEKIENLQAVRRILITDPVHADLSNEISQVLYNNDNFLYQSVTQVEDSVGNLYEELYHSATEEDIDSIILSQYTDSEDGTLGFEVANNEDIDKMIVGEYQGTEEENQQTADFGQIDKIVSDVF